MAHYTQDAGLLRDVAGLIDERLPEMHTTARLLEGASFHIGAANNPLDITDDLSRYERLHPEVRMAVVAMRGAIPGIDREAIHGRRKGRVLGRKRAFV